MHKPAKCLVGPWLLLALLTGCPSADVPLYTPLPTDDPLWTNPPDFARALELGAMAFDLTKNKVYTEDDLRARYGSATVEVFINSRVLPNDDGESRYMLLTDAANRRQTLVLAGTNTSIQWAFDADVFQAPDAELEAEVHRGWRNLSAAVLNGILPRLDPDYPISVVGFSLGAAMSCLVSEYLLHNGYNVVEIVTFGQPRVTDATGTARFADLPITRYVNAGDPFPYTAAGDYTHFGPMIVLYSGPQYAYVAAGDPMLQAGGRAFSSFAEEEFGNHSEDEYRARLEQKLSAAQPVYYNP